MRQTLTALIGLSASLLTSASSAAIIRAEGRDFESGADSITVTAAKPISGVANTLLVQFGHNTSVFGAGLSIGTSGSVSPGISLSALSSGSTVDMHVASNAWAAIATFDSGSGGVCFWDSFSSLGSASPASIAYPAAYGHCDGMNQICTLYYVTVTAGSPCPTSPGSYSNMSFSDGAMAMPFPNNSRFCAYLSYAAYSMGAPVFETQQEPGDGGIKYCECASGVCTAG